MTRSLILVLSLFLFAAGCKKKVPAPPPPPPPPPAPKAAPKPDPARIVSFSIEPSSIQRGQSATLSWEVTGADTVTIEPGIGTVPARGSRQVYPNESTVYELVARGPGGSDRRTARISVTEPPPPPAAPAPKTEVTDPLDTLVSRLISDVYFDYDKYDVREDARSQLSRNADGIRQILSKYPNAVFTLEGHCDERGSAEYNLGLGDRRSTSVRDFLAQLGVAGDKLKTISYGKERPQCSDANEGCYQKNRRVHVTAQ
ncbi:MAG: OmpA family protein [Bryobacteraceae bacterium]